MKICGLILAAGLSSRMNDLKALLALEDGTVLSKCARSLLDGGVSDVFAVTGHKTDKVEKEIRKLGAHTVYNPEYKQGMFSSVTAGIRALPEDADAFFILPVDIPLVRPATVKALAIDFNDKTADVIYPCFNGERGHPTLINSKLIPEILSHNGTGGLRSVLEEHDHKAMEREVPDSAILHDLDTLEDYAAAQKMLPRHIPLPEECEALWKILRTPLDIQEHCKKVAQAAVLMAVQLNKVRKNLPMLDTMKVRSGALMHDVAKLYPHHEKAGGAILEEYGFPVIADIVASHHDTDLKPDSPITEREIVFLADKIFQGKNLVSIEERYNATIEKWQTNSRALKAITERKQRAEKLFNRYEQEAGINILSALEKK